MKQKTTLSQSIDIVQQKAQYDEACKKVLAEKFILAWIMKHTMKEYAEYDVREIVQMIINVEAQNDFYPGYPIIKRGIYYLARMISAQYGTVFTQSHYQKIQKVYSVWICMNPPKERKNTITGYSLTETQYVGKVKEKEEYYDLMSAITVCLGKNEEETEHELLRLLDVLLSSDKKAKEKKEILENEFQIPMTERIETEVEHMCNLSDGVEQKGIEKGIEKEHLRQIKNKMEKNKSVEQIAEELELDVENVKNYIEILESK